VTTQSKKRTVDPDLLRILACPESLQGLAEADAGLLERLNARIRQGAVKNQGGTAVSEPLEAGLLREDKQRIYPIRDGIPVLLVDEGIPL
jgi:uncharacterized protein YbaR (Trm112 family)